MKCECCESREATTTARNDESISGELMNVCQECADGIADNDRMLEDAVQ